MTLFFKDRISKIQIYGRSAAMEIYYSIDSLIKIKVTLKFRIPTA